MRASTLFAITLSLLLGLGAVAGARYAGLFDKKELPLAPPEKPTVIKVLVATSTLYDDIAVTPNMVAVRDKQLSSEEERRYKADPSQFMSKYMPASTQAINFRIPKKVIPAEQVLMTDMFEDPELPPGPNKRVKDGYRAVNVAISKAKSVGGTLRLGDYVDVWLTTKVTLGSGKEAKEAIASSCVAKGCKIVMKRNTIWPVLQADPDDKPVNFTLQANPYRAAVIEYSMNRGDLSLRPAPAPQFETAKDYTVPGSGEYADENSRVQQIEMSEYTVGDHDLMRIFNLKPPPPPAPVTPPPPPVTTRRVIGNDIALPAYYDPNGGGPLVPLYGPGAAAQAPAKPTGPQTYSFSAPAKGKGATEECETCGK